MDNHAGNFNIKDLKWLGGLIDSDGCASISMNRRKNDRIVYTPTVTITNKNRVIIEVVHNLLIDYGINHHIKPNGSCKNIVISRPTVIVDFCALMYGNIIVKINEFSLLNTFCLNRIDNVNRSGCNWKATYTDTEINLAKELRKLNANHYGECVEYGITDNFIGHDSLMLFSLSWLSGFIDGDGCFTINKMKRPSGKYQYQPMVHIVTGSPLAKNIILVFLDRYNVNYYLKKSLPGKKHKANCRSKKFEFYIGSLGDCILMSELVSGKLYGKKERCLKLVEFCKSRLSRKNKPYNIYEINLHDWIKKDIKDPSTTTRKTS